MIIIIATSLKLLSNFNRLAYQKKYLNFPKNPDLNPQGQPLVNPSYKYQNNRICNSLSLLSPKMRQKFNQKKGNSKFLKCQ